jgi:AAA family ATP:ADP antiporter
MLERIKERFFDIREGEWPKAAGLAVYFFLVIAAFWILKPVKRGLILSYFSDNALTLLGWTFTAAQAEQLAKVLNMVVAYAVVIGFTLLVRRVARHHLVVIFSAVFAGLFLLFSNYVAAPGAGTVWSFYVLGDMFNTVMVATFWAFANDLNTGDEAQRLYGIVGLGGVVGGFVGATVVSTQVEALGRPTLLFICMGVVALIAGVAVGVDRYARRDDPSVACCPDESEASGVSANAAIEGAKVVFQSKYLLGIAALLGLYEIVSNIVDFQIAAYVADEIQGQLAKDEFFGFIGQLTGIASIVVQLFVTTYVLRRFGVGVALLFLPVALLLGATGFLLLPSLALVSFMRVSDNALNYSINQSAKEALYTPTSQDAKYKAKAFIDMFVQRAAKVLAVGLNIGLTALVASGVRWLSIGSLLVIIAWIFVVQYLGEAFDDRTAAEDALEEAPA